MKKSSVEAADEVAASILQSGFDHANDGIKDASFQMNGNVLYDSANKDNLENHSDREFYLVKPESHVHEKHLGMSHKIPLYYQADRALRQKGVQMTPLTIGDSSLTSLLIVSPRE